MPQTLHDRTVALAALLQSAHLVREIARRGQADTDEFKSCLASLLQLDAPTSLGIYGGAAQLQTGLRLLAERMADPRDMEVMRYTLALLTLERKLNRHPALLERLREALRNTQDKLRFFPLDHDNIVASLADAYANTISTLSPRIMVNGEHSHLSRPENASRIRALLLAGIRAAVLWRQSGGGRFTLILQRKALAAEAQRLLDSLKTTLLAGDVADRPPAG